MVEDIGLSVRAVEKNKTSTKSQLISVLQPLRITCQPRSAKMAPNTFLSTPDFIDLATGNDFFQDTHNLRLGELRLAHGNLLARVAILPESSPYDCLDLRGAYT